MVLHKAQKVQQPFQCHLVIRLIGGGNIENQQRSDTSIINSTNVVTISLLCEYISTGNGTSGYIATDKGSNNTFFTDAIRICNQYKFRNM